MNIPASIYLSSAASLLQASTGKMFKKRNCNGISICQILSSLLHVRYEAFKRQVKSCRVSSSFFIFIWSEQVPESCHALANRKNTHQTDSSADPLCYVNLFCAPKQLCSIRQNTHRHSGRFTTEPCPKLMFSPNTGTGNLLDQGKDWALVLHHKMKDRKPGALPALAEWNHFGASAYGGSDCSV